MKHISTHERFNNTFLNNDTKTHLTINVNGPNGTMIIYDNFTNLMMHM